MKKTWVLTVLTILCALCFTACAGNADTMPEPSPSASASPMPSPSVTVTTAPTASAAPTASGGVNTVEDALRVSESVAEETEKLSELDTVTAVVAGNIALVGVTYDTQYQGGLTERITEMVKDRVANVDKTLTSVQVTDDEKQVGQIQALFEKLQGKQISFEELQTQVLEIGSSLTGGGSESIAQPQSTAGA